ncbi:hypothetical protein CDL15_Pgr012891 [Punica granatum]|uniref:Uncharacterized protein n=1 Tax=Punica granatum TaxID=22663 RepID=A0A218XF77_PUNGR|nr:hypothetical protein CDL15_Pgr012891 [Punica granatum]
MKQKIIACLNASTSHRNHKKIHRNHKPFNETNHQCLNLSPQVTATASKAYNIKLNLVQSLQAKEKRKRKLEPCLACRDQDVPPAISGATMPCVWTLPFRSCRAVRLDSCLACRGQALLLCCLLTLPLPFHDLMCLEMAVSCPYVGEESALGSSLYCVWTRRS